MSERKRRWFQFHLSTCVVLMFVAGTIVWANIKETYLLQEPYAMDCVMANYHYLYRGWPMTYHESFTVSEISIKSFPENQLAKSVVYWPMFVSDLITAFAILAAAAFACEWWVRRKRRVKDDAA